MRAKSGLLEGDYPNRRMSYLSATADVQANPPGLTRIVRELLTALDEG
jgi:hypothetical protein